MDVNWIFVGYATVIILIFVLIFYMSPICKSFSRKKKKQKFLPADGQERTDVKADPPDFDMKTEVQALAQSQKKTLDSLRSDDE